VRRVVALVALGRDGGDVPPDGVVSKTVIRYTHPFDLRHSGYLVIAHDASLPAGSRPRRF